ncbi:MAG: class B sortase [Oscillospiraceae bacterium]
MNEETTKIRVRKVKKKPSNLMKAITIVIAIIFVVASAFCIKYALDIKKNKDAIKKLSELTDITNEFEAINSDLPNIDFPENIQEKYKKAYSVNTDLVGWIKVPGTSINHPVVKKDNNDYYLKHSFYHKYDIRGTVFMDYRNTRETLDKNTILYGHNFLDSTMFAELEKYKSIDFYKENPVIEFNTIYKDYKWKVIAAFLTNASKEEDNNYIFNYIYPFMTDKSFLEYTGEISQRSLYKTGVDVQKTDKVLSLSTCTRDMDIGRKETNSRFVLVARLVREGEDESVDTSKATINENPRYPQIWYDKNKTKNPYKDAPKWYPKGVAKS